MLTCFGPETPNPFGPSLSRASVGAAEASLLSLSKGRGEGVSGRKLTCPPRITARCQRFRGTFRMSEPPLVSVVVLTWNGRDLIERYLPAVVERTLAHDSRHQILVVDNGGSDGTDELVRTRFPRTRLVKIEENCGFGGGNNAGAREASHPILLFLSNDVEPQEGYLDPLLPHFLEPDLFAVMPRSLIPSREMQEEAAQRLRFRRGRLVPAFDDRWAEHARKPVPILYACGGMSAFRRDRFLEIGGFDELFYPAYWEDTDLSLRGWRRGWTVIYEPRSVVHHQHRATMFRPGDSERQRRSLITANRNWHFFMWKHLAGWRLWSRYLGWEAAYLLKDLVRLDTVRLRALWAALRQLPSALSSRRREDCQSSVDAFSVLERFGAFEWCSREEENR